MFLDTEGITEIIDFLTLIKDKDTSFHLSIGNELEEKPFDEDLFVVPHAKIINIDKLET